MGGYLRLARPANCAMSAVGVLIGGLVAVGRDAGGPYLIRLVLAAIAAMAFTAGGNALNDLFDRETDRVNHPDRPLPAGRMSAGDAWVFAGTAFAAALVLAAFVNFVAVVVVALNAGLMFGYESGWKARGFPGNVVIAYLVGSLFLFAGVACLGATLTPVARVSVLAVLAALATLGREVTKDIEDMAGDVDRRTLPQRIGARAAGAVAAAALVAGVALSALPWIWSLLPWTYLLVVLPADGMFIYAALYSAANPGLSQRVTKYGMVLALAAFLAGGLA